MEEFQEALRIHGYNFSDSDFSSSVSSYDSDDDDEYILLRPPPLPLNEMKDRIVRVPAIKKPNCWKVCDENFLEIQSNINCDTLMYVKNDTSNLHQSNNVNANNHDNSSQHTHCTSSLKNNFSKSINNAIPLNSLKEFPALPLNKVKSVQNKENHKNFKSSKDEIQTRNLHRRSSDNAKKMFSMKESNQENTGALKEILQSIQNKNKKSLTNVKGMVKVDKIISNNAVNVTEENSNKHKNSSINQENTYALKKILQSNQNKNKKSLTNVKGIVKVDKIISNNAVDVTEENSNKHKDSSISQENTDTLKKSLQSIQNKNRKSLTNVKGMVKVDKIISNNVVNATEKNSNKHKNSSIVSKKDLNNDLEFHHIHTVPKSSAVSDKKSINNQKNILLKKSTLIIKHLKNDNSKISEISKKDQSCEIMCNNNNRLSRNLVRNNALQTQICLARGRRLKRYIAKSNKNYVMTTTYTVLIALSISFIILIFYGIYKIICI